APETTFQSSSSCLDSTTTTTALETSISTAPPSIITTTLISISTATPTSPSSTTQYYDNGLWHTWYPMKEPFYPPPHAQHTDSPEAMQKHEGVAAPTGTGYAKKAEVPSGVAAASDAVIPRAAQPSGFLVAATGAAGLAGRAAPTGGARYNVVSWNETAAAF
ncbi:hypothetical protein KC336_g22579, partial [Hortaea werneckii]